MKFRNPLLTIFMALSFSASSQTGFTEVSEAQGLNFSFGTNSEFPGGLAFCDFDQDGWDDLTFTTQEGDSIRFFKNNEGNFEPFYIPSLFDTSEVMGINWVDMDNDSDLDFFICRLFGSPRIFENTGALNFVDRTPTAGLADPVSNAAQGCWADINNDGYLDLFVPVRNATLPCYMFLNNGDFTFEDVTESSGIIDTNDLALCASFLDYDNDNDQDLFISNDKIYMRNRLLQNDGSGVFTDVTDLAMVADSMDAMSVTVGDYNHDSFFDIYITNSYEGNAFLKNNGDGTFTDLADINGTKMEAIGWGAQFIDGDNNGWTDLYVSGMLTDPEPDLPSAYYYYHPETDDFSVPTGIGFEGDTLLSLSNAMGDINNDGFADLAIHNQFPDSVSFYQNNGNANNWLKVNTTGTVSNKDGIGAVIKITTSVGNQYNHTALGEGYIAQNSFTEFFGVDTVSLIDTLTILWPSGHVDSLFNMDVNQTITVVEGETAPILTGFSAESTIICAGDSTLLSADTEEDGSLYEWSNGSVGGTTYVGNGVFTLTVTNSFGFSVTSPPIIIESSEIEYTLIGIADTCGKGNGGAIIMDVSSNVDNWLWDTGETTELATGLVAGACTINLTDTLGCLYDGIVAIDEKGRPFYLMW